MLKSNISKDSIYNGNLGKKGPGPSRLSLQCFTAYADDMEKSLGNWEKDSPSKMIVKAESEPSKIIMHEEYDWSFNANSPYKVIVPEVEQSNYNDIQSESNAHCSCFKGSGQNLNSNCGICRDKKKDRNRELSKSFSSSDFTQTIKRNERSRLIGHYEMNLIRGNPIDSTFRHFFTALFTICRGGTEFEFSQLTKHRLSFWACPVFKDGSAPWCGKVFLPEPIYISRRSGSQIQVIIRVGTDGPIVHWFIIHIPSVLLEMGAGSQVILRQKRPLPLDENSASKQNTNYSHFNASQSVIHLRISRLIEREDGPLRLDRNGNQKSEKVSIVRTAIIGTVRLLFPLNQNSIGSETVEMTARNSSADSLEDLCHDNNNFENTLNPDFCFKKVVCSSKTLPVREFHCNINGSDQKCNNSHNNSGQNSFFNAVGTIDLRQKDNQDGVEVIPCGNPFKSKMSNVNRNRNRNLDGSLKAYKLSQFN